MTGVNNSFVKIRVTLRTSDAANPTARVFVDAVASQLLGHKDVADQTASDLAAVLVAEFETWFRNLGAQGVLPRAFTGVTRDGKQAVVILTGLPLNHVQRRDFLIWLCRTEQFVAYAYGTHVGIADSKSTITEGFDIYASSDRYDASKTLVIDQMINGAYKFIDRHHAILPANSKNGLFFGLQQQSLDNISSDNQELFRKLWGELKSKAIWWQR